MPVPDFTHLTSFVFQYVVATLVAIYAFATLRKRRFYSKPDFPVQKSVKLHRPGGELMGLNFFSSLERAVSTMATPLLLLSSAFAGVNVPATDLRTDLRKNGTFYPGAEFIRKSRSVFKAPCTRAKFPEIYQKRAIYDAYTAVFTVSVWAGILLLLTPYQKIFVFIPHFSSLTANLAVIIVLAITIFEGTISTVFLFIGTTRKRVALVMMTVLAVFSLSVLTPSFTWFHSYTLRGEILIYSILVILILAITFLISLLKEKRVIFRLSLYSSLVAYGFFIAITAYNIMLTLL